MSTIPAAYSLLANGLATTKVGVAFPILTRDRYADSLTSGSTLNNRRLLRLRAPATWGEDSFFRHEILARSSVWRMLNIAQSDAITMALRTENLYIGSSSVFPTSGHSNPTLTIIALCLRLADRLKIVLS